MAGPPSGLLRGVGRAASAASDQATTFGFLSGWRLVRLLPEIDADERFRVEGPRRLFERLADHCIDELFALLDMAGGLVEHHAVGDPLLDEQELPIAFHDGGDGEIGTKDHEGNITG